LIYTKHLVEGCVQHGAKVHVICNRGASQAQPMEMRGLTWDILPGAPKSHLAAAFSLVPNITARFDTNERKAVTLAAIREGNWDGIIFDGPGPLALLERIRSTTGSMRAPPFLAHVSHNHEESTRYLVARESPNLLVKAAQYIDAIKTGRLERKAVQVCDITTVNTETDAALFRQNKPDLNYLVVTPGYGGAKRLQRPLANVPLNVIVLGSFLWVAKRMNVEAFLTAAAKVFPAKGIRLIVAGFMSDDYRKTLSSRFPWADIVGPVEQTETVLSQARVGVVPEQAGGGFKHKLLDYAFARLPIASLDIAMSGMPLKPGRDYISAESLPALAETIAAHIADSAKLESIANNAYAACEHAFDWDQRARDMLEAFQALRQQ